MQDNLADYCLRFSWEQTNYVCVISWVCEPSHFCYHESCHMLPSLPRLAKLQPSQVNCKPNSNPTASLLHGWLSSSHISWFPAILGSDNPWALSKCGILRIWCVQLILDMANTYSISHVPWQDEHKRGWWADDKCAKQELVLLCGVDTSQCEIHCLWHPSHWTEDGFHIYWQLHTNKKCLRGQVSNSQLCSAGVLSCISTLGRGWTRWSSLRLRVTWITWFLSTSYEKTDLVKTDFSDSLIWVRSLYIQAKQNKQICFVTNLKKLNHIEIVNN